MKAFRMVLMLLCAAAVPLAAQRAAAPPHKRGLAARQASLNAAADSSGFRWELGADSRVAQTGDSLPGGVRAGYLLGNRFTAEAAVSAHSVAGALEGDFTAGLTGAIFPGSTNLHGEAVYGDIDYHRVGPAHQWGVVFGTFIRVIGTSGITARTGVYYRYLASHGALPSSSGVGALAGISLSL